MTYAGRLDPMASGLLLILVGKKTKEKEKYLNLGKTYEFEMLLGASTDTYDILGKVAEIGDVSLNEKEIENKIKENLKYFIGKFLQKYPLYSSKTVEGVPLFAYAREGKEVQAPEREVVVKNIKLIKIKKITKEYLLKNINKRIAKVEGDFRQASILKIWRKKLESKEVKRFYIASFIITCSSGTYVRGIANSLGEKMSIPALAYSIKRTRIGNWTK